MNGELLHQPPLHQKRNKNKISRTPISKANIKSILHFLQFSSKYHGDSCVGFCLFFVLVWVFCFFFNYSLFKPSCRYIIFSLSWIHKPNPGEFNFSMNNTIALLTVQFTSSASEKSENTIKQQIIHYEGKTLISSINHGISRRQIQHRDLLKYISALDKHILCFTILSCRLQKFSQFIVQPTL